MHRYFKFNVPEFTVYDIYVRLKSIASDLGGKIEFDDIPIDRKSNGFGINLLPYSPSLIGHTLKVRMQFGQSRGGGVRKLVRCRTDLVDLKLTKLEVVNSNTHALDSLQKYVNQTLNWTQGLITFDEYWDNAYHKEYQPSSTSDATQIVNKLKAFITHLDGKCAKHRIISSIPKYQSDIEVVDYVFLPNSKRCLFIYCNKKQYPVIQCLDNWDVCLIHGCLPGDRLHVRGDTFKWSDIDSLSQMCTLVDTFSPEELAKQTDEEWNLITNLSRI